MITVRYDKIKKSNWGTGVVRNISDDLQKELPGLRGFSYRNLQNMKQFFEEYELLQNFLLPTQNQGFVIVQSSTAQIDDNGIMPLITLINKCKEINKRIFY